MAQALEKLFLTKVAQMPQEEVELPPPSKPGDAGAKRGKKGKRVAPPSEFFKKIRNVAYNKKKDNL